MKLRHCCEGYYHMGTGHGGGGPLAPFLHASAHSRCSQAAPTRDPHGTLDCPRTSGVRSGPRTLAHSRRVHQHLPCQATTPALSHAPTSRASRHRHALRTAHAPHPFAACTSCPCSSSPKPTSRARVGTEPMPRIPLLHATAAPACTLPNVPRAPGQAPQCAEPSSSCPDPGRRQRWPRCCHRSRHPA